MVQRTIASAAVIAFTLVAFPAFAAGAKLQATGAPPAPIAPAVKSLLAETGAAVAVDGKTAVEVWIRREPERREGAAPKLGVAFGTIAEGSLIGAAHFPGGFKDYMGNAVPAGTYTLRYAVQPADGNHMGVSIHRDFLVLVRAADDADPKALAYADLLAASRKATGHGHPAVLSVFPPGKDAAVPSIVANELDQPMLVVAAGGVRLGLVFEGQGEH